MRFFVRIGSVEIQGYCALAPMAGVADAAFRRIAREFGASYTVTEMISAKALMYHDKKTAELMRLAPGEHPVAVQIFGSDVEAIRIGVPMAVEGSGADILDINMGCPTPKIVNNGDGSALMRDLRKAEAVIRAAVETSRLPVTVKCRLGWDDNSRNAEEFARMAEAAGAAAICVHGRTRMQQYAGHADWDALARVRECVSIPFLANGDVNTAEDALRLYRHTGADMVMIGRGALGNPWLFAQCNAAFAGETPPPAPTLEERLQVAARQIGYAAEEKGEHVAMLEARKHLGWYLKGYRGMAAYRARFASVNTKEEMFAIMAEIMERRDELAGGT
ncbi:MAG: tRNA dihydrouridine synthase DusB [Ruminococcaceae bacterium]|nr:tRNA dihydrouridine synthase DusB [Oscillospiraceae bacterium]